MLKEDVVGMLERRIQEQEELPYPKSDIIEELISLKEEIEEFEV